MEKDRLVRRMTTARSEPHLQRCKGLGEMNADQLWDTTMAPENRRMLQVQCEDAANASETIRLLMGKEVAPRRRFIQTDALSAAHLDV